MGGEVVLVTGGSSGIGLAAARLFVARGARVWITARGEDALRAAVAELGPTSRSFPCDITDSTSLEALAHAIQREDGRLDTLVHSAGQLALAPAEESTEIAEKLMRVTSLGLARTVRATLPLLRLGSRRSIVALSSFVGRVVPPYWSAYAASKHAV